MQFKEALMSILNFPKYDIVYDHLCTCGADVRMQEHGLGAFVKFEDVGASLNSTQQLKREIASLVNNYPADSWKYDSDRVNSLLADLRQLSRD
jgi:hypothetical protein